MPEGLPAWLLAPVGRRGESEERRPTVPTAEWKLRPQRPGGPHRRQRATQAQSVAPEGLPTGATIETPRPTKSRVGMRRNTHFRWTGFGAGELSMGSGPKRAPMYSMYR